MDYKLKNIESEKSKIETGDMKNREMKASKWESDYRKNSELSDDKLEKMNPYKVRKALQDSIAEKQQDYLKFEKSKGQYKMQLTDEHEVELRDSYEQAKRINAKPIADLDRQIVYFDQAVNLYTARRAAGYRHEEPDEVPILQETLKKSNKANINKILVSLLETRSDRKAGSESFEMVITRLTSYIKYGNSQGEINMVSKAVDNYIQSHDKFIVWTKKGRDRLKYMKALSVQLNKEREALIPHGSLKDKDTINSLKFRCITEAMKKSYNQGQKSPEFKKIIDGLYEYRMREDFGIAGDDPYIAMIRAYREKLLHDGSEAAKERSVLLTQLEQSIYDAYQQRPQSGGIIDDVDSGNKYPMFNVKEGEKVSADKVLGEDNSAADNAAAFLKYKTLEQMLPLSGREDANVNEFKKPIQDSRFYYTLMTPFKDLKPVEMQEKLNNVMALFRVVTEKIFEFKNSQGDSDPFDDGDTDCLSQIAAWECLMNGMEKDSNIRKLWENWVRNVIGSNDDLRNAYNYYVRKMPHVHGTKLKESDFYGYEGAYATEGYSLSMKK